MNELDQKQLLKKIRPYCRHPWIGNGKLNVECDPLQVKKISQLLNCDAIPSPFNIPNQYSFDISDLDVNQIKGY